VIILTTFLQYDKVNQTKLEAQKRIVDILAKNNDELEIKVNKRTKQLNLAKEEAETSRVLISNVLNNSREGITALKAVRNSETQKIEDFSCLVINPVLADVFTEKPEQLIGKLLLKDVLPDISLDLFNSFVSVVETGNTLDLDFSYTYREKLKWYNLSTIKFGDGLIITIRDITEIKQELLNEVATRNKLEGELEAGKTIQMSMLAQHGEATQKRADYDLWVALKYAKAVSGDLYFFEEQNPHQICFGVGDVADKGIPAALFMSKTMTLLNQVIHHESNPSAILYFLNNELEKNNENCMFVSLFCGILNLETGELHFASAGHKNPILLRNNQVIELEQKDGSALGLMEDENYDTNFVQMQTDDKIIIYTDGVDETFNDKEEMLGMDGFIDSLQDCHNNSADKIGLSILETITNFRKNAPQSDDITIMILDYHHDHHFLIESQLNQQQKKIITNKSENISVVANFLESYCQLSQISEDVIHDLKLISEEILSNIINYGNCQIPEIEVFLGHNDQDILFEVIDIGKPFNPLEDAKDPELGLCAEDVAIGGLGVFLVRELSDYQSYQRDGEKNRFCILKKY